MQEALSRLDSANLSTISYFKTYQEYHTYEDSTTPKAASANLFLWTQVNLFKNINLNVFLKAFVFQKLMDHSSNCRKVVFEETIKQGIEFASG